MLELLTLCGKLASFEPIAASLRSADEKSRSTAIETIEQACPRKVRRLLPPLLDERESDRRLALARAANPGATAAVREWILELVAARDEVDAALGLELLRTLDPEEAGRRARDRLLQSGEDLAFRTAADIVRRMDGEHCETPLAKAAALTGLASTAGLDVRSLLALADAEVSSEQAAATVRLLSLSAAQVALDAAAPQNAEELRHFDLDELLSRSHHDPAVAKGLYRLLRSADNATHSGA